MQLSNLVLDAQMVIRNARLLLLLLLLLELLPSQGVLHLELLNLCGHLMLAIFHTLMLPEVLVLLLLPLIYPVRHVFLLILDVFEGGLRSLILAQVDFFPVSFLLSLSQLEFLDGLYLTLHRFVQLHKVLLHFTLLLFLHFPVDVGALRSHFRGNISPLPQLLLLPLLVVLQLVHHLLELLNCVRVAQIAIEAHPASNHIVDPSSLVVLAVRLQHLLGGLLGDLASSFVFSLDPLRHFF